MNQAEKPKTRRGEETRNRIIQVAMELMVANDPSGVTLDRIAEAAGTAKSSILWHFGSKEELFLSIMDTVIQDFEAAFSKNLPAGTDALASFERFLEDYAGMMRACPQAHAVFFSFVFMEKKTTEIEERIRKTYRLCRGLLAAHIRKLGFSDPDELAVCIGALVDGVFIQWHADPEGVRPEEAFRSLVKTLRLGSGATLEKKFG